MSSLLAVVVLALAFQVPCSSVVLRRFAHPCCHQVFDGGQVASRNIVSTSQLRQNVHNVFKLPSIQTQKSVESSQQIFHKGSFGGHCYVFCYARASPSSGSGSVTLRLLPRTVARAFHLVASLQADAFVWSWAQDTEVQPATCVALAK